MQTFAWASAPDESRVDRCVASEDEKESDVLSDQG
jgi:hypothetical protein